MRAAAWAGGDAAWTAVSVALAPRVLLGHAVEENPVEYLEVAVFLVTLTRACWFYGLWPRHAGYAKSGETARTFTVQTIATQVAGTCILHAVLVLFGAPFIQMAGRTFLCAALLANLAVTPFAWISTRSSDTSAIGHEFADFFIKLESETAVDRILLTQAFGTLAGAWLGALPIPLDWDRPWQAWPATIVYGAFAGFCLGSGVGVFLSTVMFPAASKKQR